MRLICFDDGPTEFTSIILDHLEDAEVTAIFGVVGDRAMERPDVVRRIVREGHTIANHTMTHARLTDLSWDQACVELLDCDKLIRAIAGVVPKHLRPPFAAVNRRVEKVASHFGYALLRESSMGDYLYDDPGEIVHAAKDFPSFLGLHDNHAPTAAALPEILAAV